MKIRYFRRVGFVAAAVLPVVAAGLAVAGPAGAQSRAHLRGTHPGYARAAARTGAAKGTSIVTGRVWLRFNNAAAVTKLVQAVTDRHSSQYGHYLTPQQFNQRFSPTSAQVASVTKWLKGAGIAVTSVPSTHRYVAFRGDVAHVGKAFGTSYGVYRYKGSSYYAPSTDASVPASLGSTVLTATGLDSMPNIVKPLRSGPFPPPAGFRNGRPCSLFYGEKTANFEADGTTALPKFNGHTLKYAVCGYTPPQLRGAYGLNPDTADGSGVTIAIVDAYAAPTIVSDANTYVDNHDSASPHLVLGSNFLETDAANFTRGKFCTGNGWYGEETLDVEAAHGMAPGATIHYYGGANCTGQALDDANQQAIDDGVDVISNSFGDVELLIPVAEQLAEHQTYEQAAAQGITLSTGSGDDGDDTIDTGGVISVDTAGNDPLVTSVGGTVLGISKTDTVNFETGWGTEKWALTSDANGNPAWTDVGFLYGSGGGVSNIFTQPDYQKGIAPNVDARVQPDISLDGDVTTGMLVGETQRFGKNPQTDAYDEFRLGGTSLSSPLFAGVIAVADELATNSGHGNVGFANPSIYSLVGTGAIRDVVHAGVGNVRADFANGIDASGGLLYSVRTFDQDSSLTTHAGYDEVTGVGTPTGSFPAAMAALAPTAV